MTTNAQAILTAANKVLEAWEAGDFPAPNEEGISTFEWQDGTAVFGEDGQVWVTIPNQTYLLQFSLDIMTGEIQRDKG